VFQIGVGEGHVESCTSCYRIKYKWLSEKKTRSGIVVIQFYSAIAQTASANKKQMATTETDKQNLKKFRPAPL
jgi:hypothetical protein